jgi:hypothetical protein
MTCAAINEALPTMQPGERLIYHVGSLMYDRIRGPAFGTVHGAAQAAWEAHTRGEVTLVQHKVGPNVYEYIAIKRPAPKVAAKVDGKVARKRAHA